jgi:MFS family permease
VFRLSLLLSVSSSNPLTVIFYTAYYQFLLAFSILSGIGNSFLFTPAMGAISHWFDKRRGTASGFAFTGSGFGGVLFPLMVQALVPKVGWPWTMRIIGFVLLVLCVLSLALCRSRLPPLKSKSSLRDMLPSSRIFKDGTGAMAVTTAGVFFIEWAYFVPVTYVPSYYLARQNLRGGDAVSGDAAFAYQLLAILNGASCIGRYLPGYISDKIGRYNTMILGSFLAMAAVLGLWLPDATSSQPPSIALIIVFVVVFGFASGANITLTPICIGQLCNTQEYGRYYASAFTCCAFGCLTSIPIAGNILTATSGSGRQGYWGVILFAGISYLAAFSCFLWVRIRVKGTSIKTVW